MGIRQIATIAAFALVGWALCFATIGIGQAVTTLQTALVIHAIAAPMIFAALSWLYFTRFAYTRPLPTAVAFTGIVVFMDFFVVALLILHSFAMFTSFLGTWLPFTLIFASTLLTGIAVQGSKVRDSTA